MPRRSRAILRADAGTFGFRRLEILAAHVNGITLVVVGVVIVYTAIRRLIDPPDVRGGVVLVVAALIFWSSLTLLRESTRILLEVAPDEPGEVAAEMLSASVVEVHDLHVWTVGSGFPSVSAHVLVEPGADCHAIRLELAKLLGERFGLSHSTLQVEHASPASARRQLPLAAQPPR